MAVSSTAPPPPLREVLKVCRCFPSWAAPPLLLLPSPTAWTFLMLPSDVDFSYLARCLFDQCSRHDCVTPDRKSIKGLSAESLIAQRLRGVGDRPRASRAFVSAGRRLTSSAEARFVRYAQQRRVCGLIKIACVRSAAGRGCAVAGVVVTTGAVKARRERGRRR